MSQTRILVVIVNYRVTGLTLDCLHSVAPEIAKTPGLKVAVCDNGTSAEDAARIAAEIENNNWQDWCTLTAIMPNLGFTGGNNAILRPAMQEASPPDYFILLNADTVVRPGALAALVDFMDAHPEAGIAGSRLEDPDGTPQRSAFRFQSPLGEFESTIKLGPVSRLLSRWIVAPEQEDRVFAPDWVSGAAMIVRRAVFAQVGLLDEGLYTYYDDIDLCLRAKRAGFLSWYVPQSRIVHLGGQSTGVSSRNVRRLPSYHFQARRRFFLKNHGALYAAAADAGMIAGAALWALRRAITREAERNPEHFLADAWRHSVFATGFAVTEVQNPALAPKR